MTERDARWMARALALARRGLYTARPNPSVGCVIVQDETAVGEGWHARRGEPHAEIEALARASGNAHSATVYVTLEPCCHRGYTGPCTEALIEAGVRRVVVAMDDPNPLVNGRGAAALEAAGIEVERGVLAEEALALNRGFASRMARGKPYVRCKLAMSLDGRTAMASGESQWITSAEARRDVQRLRAGSAAIMTGIGTVLADDPSLTVRAGELGEALPARFEQPLRVVLDSSLRMPAGAKMLGLPGATLVAAAAPAPGRSEALRAAGAEVLVAENGGRVDLAALLDALGEREINDVLLECGPVLGGAMLQASLVDELVLYVAPLLLGAGARGLLELPGLARLADAIRVQIEDVRPLGPDWRVTAKLP